MKLFLGMKMVSLNLLKGVKGKIYIIIYNIARDKIFR